MESRFCRRDEIENKLVNTYMEHGDLIIAYDFDDTIKPFNPEDSCDTVINLIKRCQKLGFTTYLWTCREGSRLQQAIEYCNSKGLYPTYINRMPGVLYAEGRKPYCNILLDDKAGLDSTVETLTNVLNIIENENNF